MAEVVVLMINGWIFIVRQGAKISATAKAKMDGVRPGKLKGEALLVPLAALVLLVFSVRGQEPGPGTSSPRHVLVISVDGLGASFCMSPPPGLSIPNLRYLEEQGSFAEAVEGVYPTVTYPSHTTLVTGRFPAEHGIYSNLSSRQAGKDPNDWFWFAEAIKVRTLWDEARAAGLTSAAVSWPVTAGAAIDWNVPEIWDPRTGPVGDPAYLAKFMNPFLTQEIAAALGAPQRGGGDASRTRLAIYLLTKHKPGLFLLHLAELDGAEHRYGPESGEAAAVLERTDARLGEILAGMKEAGLEKSTDIFILSDHGFLTIDRTIRPNVLLAKAGLLTVDAQGVVTGGKIATVPNGGSFFIYWPAGQDLRRQVEAALRPLVNQGMLWAVLDRQALVDLGAEPAVQLALEAPAGAHFDSGAKGDVVSGMKSRGGAHGYLPFRAGLDSTFIAWGPRIKSGVNLHRIRMTAIGPTLLKDLGIDDPHFGVERPLDGIFK